ncbi:MAG: helix-turn-helix domain-containing protein [Enterobacterales bacterium endosymbiont of Blomia tropicalis]|uniref:helix-turn-helix domain-containing protein n=1 Tax=Mixta mediterraneensis TaxID=2758443 RepID=UPI00187722AC|nr:helix-turn-helix domain-containing protein [Mixta mediterraneensis]MBE5251924.1 helix-turn-helix domain-containing protein [Mixta mediterraneensis]MDL4914945.1 helix-turn-helix domain-containing protein [Mixta mediterraneensis]
MSEENNEWTACDNEVVSLTPDTCCLLDYQGKREYPPDTHIIVMNIWHCAQTEQSIDILYTTHNSHFCLPSAGRYRIQTIYSLSEMLAFFDESRSQLPDLPAKAGNYYNLLLAEQGTRCWFTLMYLSHRSNSDFVRFCEFLRKNEAYWLVRYLLPHRCSPEKIIKLSKEYGFSYSYFRRVVHQFFGMTAKQKLLSWRISQTVLDIIDGKGKITDIALQNGFSSSSHASTTIKKQLGLKPLAIRNIRNSIR